MHPFFTKEAEIAAPKEIKGEWILTKNANNHLVNNVKLWIIGDETVTTYNEKDVSSILMVHYFKVGDTIFADLSIGEVVDYKKYNFSWYAHVIPVHSVVKIKTTKNNLFITPFNYHWLEKELKSKRISPLSIPFSENNIDNFRLYTASSEAWMGLLEKYKDDDGAFPKDRQYVLKRNN